MYLAIHDNIETARFGKRFASTSKAHTVAVDFVNMSVGGYFVKARDKNDDRFSLVT